MIKKIPDSTICMNCHRKHTSWISFQRVNASSSVIHSVYICNDCGYLSKVQTSDEEIANAGTV